MGADRKL